MLENQTNIPGPDLQAKSAESLEVGSDTPNALLHFAQRYGDVVNLSVGSQSLYLLAHPDAIRDVLVRQHHSVMKPIERTSATPFLGNGLMRSEKDAHQDKRRVLQPLFYRQHLAHYDAVITRSTQEFSRHWQPGQTVDMSDEMMRLTLRILGQILFGTDIEQEQTALNTALFTIMRMTQQNHTRTLVIGNRALEATNVQQRRAREIALSHLFPIFDAVIHERRATDQRGQDILATLLHSNTELPDAPGGYRPHPPLSDQQVREEIVTLLLAGHESTAHALMWGWYLLARNPEVASILRTELQEVLGARAPTSQDLASLPHLRRAISEILRLYPPVWAIARTLQEPLFAHGYLIPRNATVLLSQWVVHHDPRWFPDPNGFDLRRWSPESSMLRPKYSYFPFGGGPRLCLGESLVGMLISLIFATLLMQWNATLSPHAVQIEASVTLRPKGGLAMTLLQS